MSGEVQEAFKLEAGFARTVPKSYRVLLENKSSLAGEGVNS